MNEPINEQILRIATTLQEEAVAYNEKPSKASSKRLRMLLGNIKKQTASLRADLMEADSDD